MKSTIAILALLISMPLAKAADLPDVQMMEHRKEQHRVAQRNAPINSAILLQEHIQHLSADSPLRVFSTPARQRFISSLRFNEAGITTYSYRDIVNELTYSEAYRLLALFGAERTLGKIPALRNVEAEDERIFAGTLQSGGGGEDDHPGYACVGRATCSRSAQEICMTGC